MINYSIYIKQGYWKLAWTKNIGSLALIVSSNMINGHTCYSQLYTFTLKAVIARETNYSVEPF